MQIRPTDYNTNYQLSYIAFYRKIDREKVG